MKKEKTTLDNVESFDDYKMEYVMDEIKQNFESTEKWLYLGADAANSNFAKVGLTMGDLSSRSYSSGNPNYFLFCAFKCKYDLSKNELKNIENHILTKLEHRYRNNDGSSKRQRHYESGSLSECFFPIDFVEFFVDLHFEIYENYRNSFVISGMDDGFGGVDGEFVYCIFNSKIEDHHHYRRMIIQY